MSIHLLKAAREQVEQADIKTAIDLVWEFCTSNRISGEERWDTASTNILLLRHRYTKLIKENTKGVITLESYKAKSNQIVSDILYHIGELEALYILPINSDIATSRDVAFDVRVKTETEEVSIHFSGSVEGLQCEGVNELLNALRRKIEQKKGGLSSIDITDIDEGSIRLSLKMSKEDLSILEDLISAGELDDLGFLRLEKTSNILEYVVESPMDRTIKGFMTNAQNRAEEDLGFYIKSQKIILDSSNSKEPPKPIDGALVYMSKQTNLQFTLKIDISVFYYKNIQTLRIDFNLESSPLLSTSFIQPVFDDLFRTINNSYLSSLSENADSFSFFNMLDKRILFIVRFDLGFDTRSRPKSFYLNQLTQAINQNFDNLEFTIKFHRLTEDKIIE